MLKNRHILFFILFFLVSLLVFPIIAFASDASLSKSFNFSGNITNGSLVSLTPSKENTVELANESNSSNLVGVSISNNQSLIEVNPSSNTIQVATQGSVYALVSDVNGSISMGNQIAVSPFSGVGMKANVGSTVIGVAQSSFNAKSTAKKMSVYTKSGKKQTIRVGYIKILILLGQAKSPTVINGLQNFTEALTGKPISNTRVIISFVIAVLGLVSIITIVYASIDGTIISIGRNPLAKSNVFRILRNVAYFAVIILIICVSSVYLLLR